jgi:gamma-glutamyltranspeptidase/glutathione hydrolase
MSPTAYLPVKSFQTMRQTLSRLFSSPFLYAAVAGLFLCDSLIAQQPLTPYSYSIPKKALVNHGAVVSAHPLASQVGVSILQQGGNAFDAAIATQLALAVVYPAAGNIGGGGFMVAHLATAPHSPGKPAAGAKGAAAQRSSAATGPKGRDIALDFRERAPAAATRDMYLDAAGNPVKGLSENGHLASGVPGTIAGLFAEFKYAKLPFAKLIQPAIDLAENGFVITAEEARNLNHDQGYFKQYNTVQPVFLRTREWAKGDTLVQKDLAKTLRLIRDKGAKGFYEGETARLILEEMHRGKGIITAADLQGYKAIERTPSIFPYKNYSIVTMPLPSSGGVVLQQMLKMVENQPLAAYGFESVKAIHLMTEVERLAYADRAQYLGDRDFFSVPVDTLVSPAYIRTRLALIPAKAGNSRDIKAGVLSPASEETTHLDVIDAKGNAVSITTTLNGGYGNKVVVGGAGFFLNNEMDDFSIKPGVPNMYGAVGTEANAIAPGKRMLSSMSPTIVLDNKGKVYLVIGTPGGTTITTSVFQTLVDILDFGLSTDDAVNFPKFHHQWLPDVIYVEPGLSIAVQDSLKVMGYTVAQRGSIGRTEAIKVLPDQHIEAVADNRGDDAAVGY